MTYLEALSFAIEDCYDNRKNAVVEEAERFYQDIAETLERLEDDLIKMLDGNLTLGQFRKAVAAQTSHDSPR